MSTSSPAPQAAPPTEWLTPAEAAELSGYSPWYVRRLVASGRLKGHKPGVGEKARVRIRRADLDAFLAGDAGPTA